MKPQRRQLARARRDGHVLKNVTVTFWMLLALVTSHWALVTGLAPLEPRQ